jgi:hypothetical protein
LRPQSHHQVVVEGAILRNLVACCVKESSLNANIASRLCMARMKVGGPSREPKPLGAAREHSGDRDRRKYSVPIGGEWARREVSGMSRKLGFDAAPLELGRVMRYERTWFVAPCRYGAARMLGSLQPVWISSALSMAAHGRFGVSSWPSSRIASPASTEQTAEP